MPILHVNGISEKYDPKTLMEIRQRLREKISSIKQLKLEETDVSVNFFPNQPLTNTTKLSDLRSAIIILVYLHKKTERTRVALQHMSSSCAWVLRNYFSTVQIGCHPIFLDSDTSYVFEEIKYTAHHGAPDCPICGEKMMPLPGGKLRRCVNCSHTATTTIN